MEIQIGMLPVPSAGMNLEVARTELADNEATLIQDGLFTEEGTLWMRGANSVSSTAIVSGFPYFAGAYTTNLLSSGSDPVVLYSTGTNLLTYPGGADTGVDLPDSRATVTQASTPEGVLIGILGNPLTDSWTYHGLGFTKQTSPAAVYSTGQIAAGGASNTSPTITGTGTTWTSSHIGMYLYIQADECTGSNYLYAGQVQSRASNTSISLMDNARCSCAGAKNYVLLPFKPWESKIGRGRMTTSTSSTVATGFNSVLTQEMLGGLNWHLYRLKDNRWVGRVTAVNNDTTLTLNANAAVAMNEEAFYCVPERSVPSGSFNLAQASGASYGIVPGALVCAHKGRYWYANRPGNALGVQRNRVYFSRTGIPELLDLADGGYYFDIATNSGYVPYITGMASINGVLLVFTQAEVYAITGDSPANFTVNKVSGSGCLAGNSIRTYEDSVIYLSKKGVFRTNGTQFVELTAKISKYFRNLIIDCDMATTSTANAYAMVANNHYIVCVNNMLTRYDANDYFDLNKNPALVVNLETGALSFFSNFALVGTVDVPDLAYYLRGYDNGTNYPIAKGKPQYLFKEKYGVTFTDQRCAVFDGSIGSAVPFLIWISKIYTLNDPMQIKFVKGMDIEIQDSAGSSNEIYFYYLEGIGSTYSSITKVLTSNASADFETPLWVPIDKRSRNFSFKITTSSPSTHKAYGPIRLQYRLLRPRRK